MHRVLVLVPFAFGEEGVANREAAKQWVELGPDIQFDFRPVKAGPEMYDSYHDWLLADMSMYEAGITAQDEGYDAVVLDAMNDPGMSALNERPRHRRLRRRARLGLASADSGASRRRQASAPTRPARADHDRRNARTSPADLA